jgi:hypothetical protein
MEVKIFFMLYVRFVILPSKGRDSNLRFKLVMAKCRKMEMERE